MVWFQGCSIGCPGCFNPETHSKAGGKLIEVESLVQQIVDLGDQIEGVTVSGGEPLEQIEGLLTLVKAVRVSTANTIVVFTGKTWKQVSEMPEAEELLGLVDVLIAGPYQQRQRVATGLKGSRNKTFHFLTTRYTQADFDSIPKAEIIIESDGTIVRSGIGWDSKT